MPASSTALVSSSTNSGLPSVLATICFITSAGSTRPPVTCATILSTFVAVEATERQGADVGETNPGRLELRSEGEQCKDRQLAHPLDHQIEQLEGGGIRPVRVLEHEQDRLPAGETLELIEQCRKRPAALLRGAERQRRIPLAERDRQQRSKKRRYGLNPRSAQGEERFQLVKALLGAYRLP